MTAQIISVSSTRELLRHIPHLTDCFPRESIVLVPFAGSRTLGALRFDLPARDHELDRTAATLLGYVCRLAEADGIAVVSYTSARAADGSVPALLVDEILRRTDECGLVVIDALCVHGEGWLSYLDPAISGPLDDLEPGDAWSPPARDQTAQAALPAVESARRERVGAELAGLERAAAQLLGCGRRRDDGDTRPPRYGGPQARADRPPRDADAEDARRADVLTEVVADLPALFEGVLSARPAELSDGEAAVLIWCLDRPGLRDIALTQWSAQLETGERAWLSQQRWEAGEPSAGEETIRLFGEGHRPPPERIEQALAVMRLLAALAPDDWRAGPLSCAAWLCWAMGRSSHAAVHLADLARIEPRHGLAQILTALIEAGRLPDWAFQPPVAEPV